MKIETQGDVSQAVILKAVAEAARVAEAFVTDREDGSER